MSKQKRMIWALFLKRKRLKALLVEDCFIEFFSSLVLDYKPYNLNSTIVSGKHTDKGWLRKSSRDILTQFCNMFTCQFIIDV